jgi:FdrA protein
MMDNTLRIQRLLQEADDPEVAVVLLDVVLGYGSHDDPASELAPAIAQAIAKGEEAGRRLEVVAVVVGTDLDPQGMDDQIEQLKEAGAWVETRNDVATRYVGELIQALGQDEEEAAALASTGKPVDLTKMNQPLAGINVGLESFTESLIDQEAAAIQVDWRPPAGGNEKLAALLERMKSKQ